MSSAMQSLISDKNWERLENAKSDKEYADILIEIEEEVFGYDKKNNCIRWCWYFQTP